MDYNLNFQKNLITEQIQYVSTLLKEQSNQYNQVYYSEAFSLWENQKYKQCALAIEKLQQNYEAYLTISLGELMQQQAARRH